jgi:hypothetical protein
MRAAAVLRRHHVTQEVDLVQRRTAASENERIVNPQKGLASARRFAHSVPSRSSMALLHGSWLPCDQIQAGVAEKARIVKIGRGNNGKESPRRA